MAIRPFNRGLKRLAARVLDMPHDVVYDLPRLTMIGDRQLYIENHRGLLLFTNDKLRLSLHKGELEVLGQSLEIRSITTEEMLVEGNIQGIQMIGT